MIAETTGYISLFLLIAVIFIRLIFPTRILKKTLMVVASLALITSIVFDAYYEMLFASRYGLLYAAYIPPISLIIGKKPIAGVLPGVLYPSFSGILALYLLVELILARRSTENSI